MIVRLSAQQVAEVEVAAVRNGEFGAPALPWVRSWQRVPGHRQTYDCTMPAIGWLRVLALLADVTVGPRGGNSKEAARSAVTARNRIAKSAHVYFAHPAFSGIGLHGRHTIAFPAWAIEGAEKPAQLYSPIPVEGAEFVNLLPTFVREFTIWHGEVPLDLGFDSILDERAHLAFTPSGRGASPVDDAIS